MSLYICPKPQNVQHQDFDVNYGFLVMVMYKCMFISYNKYTTLVGDLIMGEARQHIKKQRHYFANKCPSSQSYGFSSTHDGCESWTIKKAEYQRIDAFELWCWRRLLRVPWTARRSNQSILKEISLGCSLEGLLLKLKLQYFGHLMGRMTHWKRL